MEQFNKSKETYFYVIGLSYKKADAEIRGRFSLDEISKLFADKIFPSES